MIFDPAAGGGASRTMDLVSGPEGPRTEVVVTEERGDAREAARERREGLLVIAGDDGTLNEAVDGLGEPGFPGGISDKRQRR